MIRGHFSGGNYFVVFDQSSIGIGAIPTSIPAIYMVPPSAPKICMSPSFIWLLTDNPGTDRAGRARVACSWAYVLRKRKACKAGTVRLCRSAWGIQVSAIGASLFFYPLIDTFDQNHRRAGASGGTATRSARVAKTSVNRRGVVPSGFDAVRTKPLAFASSMASLNLGKDLP